MKAGPGIIARLWLVLILPWMMDGSEQQLVVATPIMEELRSVTADVTLFLHWKHLEGGIDLGRISSFQEQRLVIEENAVLVLEAYIRYRLANPPPVRSATGGAIDVNVLRTEEESRRTLSFLALRAIRAIRMLHLKGAMRTLARLVGAWSNNPTWRGNHVLQYAVHVLVDLGLPAPDLALFIRSRNVDLAVLAAPLSVEYKHADIDKAVQEMRERMDAAQDLSVRNRLDSALGRIGLCHARDRNLAALTDKGKQIEVLMRENGRIDDCLDWYTPGGRWLARQLWTLGLELPEKMSEEIAAMPEVVPDAFGNDYPLRADFIAAVPPEVRLLARKRIEAASKK